MLSFPPAVCIWLATKPADIRKSFDGLAELIICEPEQTIPVDQYSLRGETQG